MVSVLTRYWLEFHPHRRQTSPIGFGGPPWMLTGCGVTASSLDEALAIVAEASGMEELPPLRRSIEDVDTSTLEIDSRAIGVSVWRGMWYPVEQIDRRS